MCFAPARAVNPAHAEIGRAYKAVGSTIEPISFIVPRKVGHPPAPRLFLLSSPQRNRSILTPRGVTIRVVGRVPSRPLPTRSV